MLGSTIKTPILHKEIWTRWGVRGFLTSSRPKPLPQFDSSFGKNYIKYCKK
ncbi:hypothetical protein Scep_019416 [Stephania cephalantha]|uniref:Uncharacterized protein n=1 Tax=Stephania cephalantha TaxID=152367 RepID=A0AAP0IB05_9MAGN